MLESCSFALSRTDWGRVVFRMRYRRACLEARDVSKGDIVDLSHVRRHLSVGKMMDSKH
jgi:hypothetical protein